MSNNLFIPQQRTAILAFDNGQRVRAEILVPKSDRPEFYDELERRFIESFRKLQPRAIHKLVKVHFLRN
uniref:hypothetical protein n=1 Tax=Prevotella sp. TaxID=59823 RepID=UPI004026CC5D